MISLSIDSTTSNISIAIDQLKDNNTDLIYDRSSHKHLKRAVTMIDGILTRNSLDINDIGFFGVNLGPGDFTGTRIGITIIKVFALLSKKKVYGFNALDVSSVKALRGFKRSVKNPTIVSPLLDVRNDEIYYSFFKVLNKPFSLKRISEYHLSDKGSFIKDFKLDCKKALLKSQSPDDLIISGNAQVRYMGVIEELVLQLSEDGIGVSVDTDSIDTDAEDVSRLARYYHQEKIQSLDNVYPVYVRDFKVFKKDERS